jgi:hypothetical protein
MNVFISDRADPMERFAAEELCKNLSKLSGAVASVNLSKDHEALGGAGDIVLGVRGLNPIVAEILAHGNEPGDLGSEGFVVRKTHFRNKLVWLVSGDSPRGVLYGAYALLEAAGMTFQISGDLSPDPYDDFSLPEIDDVQRPEFERRGFLLPFPLNLHESMWGLDDYRQLIDQMAKLRLNYINLNITGADPMLEYTFRGERNLIGDVNTPESGYLVARMHVPNAYTDQVEIGKEHFAGIPSMAPPELRGVPSPEEAHRRCKAMFLEIFAHAARRGVEIGFTMDVTEIPYNFARFMKRNDNTPSHRTIAGARVDHNDPLFEEHTVAWLTALYETYPDAVDLFFWNAEGYHKAPDGSDNEHRKVIERFRPQFEEAKRTFEENWEATCCYSSIMNKTAQDVIDTDIIQMKATIQIIDISKRLRPDFAVGFGFLFRGYLLQSVDRIVDKDIPFIDFQSSAVIPISNDINAQYCAGMGERKRYIIPRVDDDDSMFGMPFYLRQFQTDGVFKEAKEAGATGFIAQMFRARGTEHHVSFLARGGWNSDLTPDAFYDAYAEEVFGSTVSSSMRRVFDLFEDSEELLAWQGLSNFHWLGGPTELYSGFSTGLADELTENDNPYDGPSEPAHLAKCARSRYHGVDNRVPAGEYIPDRIEYYRRSITLLEGAAAEMLVAQANVSAKGRRHLAYLINKTEAFIAHLEMVALSAEGLATYAEAFANHAGDETALANTLVEAEQTFCKAQIMARKSATIFARIIDHPSDLAILFLANIFNIQKVDKVAAVVRRVANYHQGHPYWPEHKVR